MRDPKSQLTILSLTMSDRQSKVAATLRAGRALGNGSRQPQRSNSRENGSPNSARPENSSERLGRLRSSNRDDADAIVVLTPVSNKNRSTARRDNTPSVTTAISTETTIATNLIALPHIPTGLSPIRPRARESATRTTQVHQQSRCAIASEISNSQSVSSQGTQAHTRCQSPSVDILLHPATSSANFSELDRELGLDDQADTQMKQLQNQVDELQSKLLALS